MYGVQLNCFQCAKESLLYLGSFLCNNGSIRSELNRRLGAARAEFEILCRVWNHAVLPKAEKNRIFELSFFRVSE